MNRIVALKFGIILSDIFQENVIKTEEIIRIVSDKKIVNTETDCSDIYACKMLQFFDYMQ